MLGVLGTRLVRNPHKLREGGDYLREAGSLRYRFVCPRSESLGEILPGGKHGHRRARTSPLDLPHDRSPVPIGQYQVDHRQIERTVHGDDPQGLSDRGGVGEYREIARLLWVVGEDTAEPNRQPLREEDMVVDDQDVRHGSLSFAVRWQFQHTAMNRR
jgi:hypothetical protein